MNELKYLKSKGIKDNPRIIDVSGQVTEFYLQDLLKDYKEQLILHGVVGSVLLADLLKESQEVIAINGLRFTGTHEEAIKNVFDKHGINYEPAF